MDFIKNPVVICRKIFEYIHEMTVLIRTHLLNGGTDTLYHSETWDLCLRRWLKLEKDFYNIQKDKFNISKVPDIYDSIKYDLLHNKNLLQFPHGEDLYVCSKALADIVVPQEYGMTIEEKLSIARGIVTPLLRKIRADLQCNLTGVLTHDEHVNKLDPSYSKGIQSPGRHVRTRLYFTSESHVHSLLTIIRYGGLLNASTDEQWKRSVDYLDAVSELDYLTQIVIMLYEDSSEEEISEKRFHVELHFSPGAYGCFGVPSEIDRVTSDVNTIRTVLPKSTREAAHSPPRQHTNSPILDSSSETNTIPITQSTNQIPTIVTVDCTPSIINTEKTKAKNITEPMSLKTHHRNSEGKIALDTSESNDFDQIHSASAPRSTNYDNYLLKPKSLEHSDLKLEQSILTHNYYNTIHGVLPDKRKFNYVPLTSIFSTRVITGAKSTPDLNKLLERKQAGLVYSETSVVAPLETLTTNLNYKILDEFIGKMTDLTSKFLLNTNTSITLPPFILTSDVPTNRFSIVSVDNNNGIYGNDKKPRIGFIKLTQYSINTINELPEKSLDEER
ncbi:unnamed protein product [Rotaria sordida]|uniref:Inositol hexakisphosphate and diphosphoinositol-pentakisphosphate kinase n=1 Tax=Rotaria sordida TaxID=392033 RepID=A0A814YKM7_9BILA|nr:unnamed protein product [Rotaria sordida]